MIVNRGFPQISTKEKLSDRRQYLWFSLKNNVISEIIRNFAQKFNNEVYI